MIRNDIATELAYRLDEDEVTTKELAEVIEGMHERMGREPMNTTLRENCWSLEDAMQELLYWEATAEAAEDYGGELTVGETVEEQRRRESGGTSRRPLPFSRLFVIDENRQGVAREQIIDALTQSALPVYEGDLVENGFARVVTVTDPVATSGMSTVYYRPDGDRWILASDHRKELDLLFSSLVGGGRN